MGVVGLEGNFLSAVGPTWASAAGRGACPTVLWAVSLGCIFGLYLWAVSLGCASGCFFILCFWRPKTQPEESASFVRFFVEQVESGA